MMGLAGTFDGDDRRSLVSMEGTHDRDPANAPSLLAVEGTHDGEPMIPRALTLDDVVAACKQDARSLAADEGTLDGRELVRGRDEILDAYIDRVARRCAIHRALRQAPIDERFDFSSDIR